jgi:hypothetical protein
MMNRRFRAFSTHRFFTVSSIDHQITAFTFTYVIAPSSTAKMTRFLPDGRSIVFAHEPDPNPSIQFLE